MNNMEFRELPEFTRSMEVMMKSFAASLDAEGKKQFLDGLTPQELLTGMKPEDKKILLELLMVEKKSAARH